MTMEEVKELIGRIENVFLIPGNDFYAYHIYTKYNGLVPVVFRDSETWWRDEQNMFDFINGKSNEKPHTLTSLPSFDTFYPKKPFDAPGIVSNIKQKCACTILTIMQTGCICGGL